jgi:hypothetical protein
MMTNAAATTDRMYELALGVRSRGDFVRFLESLAEDYELNQVVWENHSVPEFLLALADCSRRAGESAEAAPPRSGSEFWQHVACLLLGASVVR